MPILAGATWAHWGNGWMFGYPNGGWEYPLYLTLLAVVQFMLGDGAYALVRSRSSEGVFGSSATPAVAR
jgi:putative oxidoreductase